MSHPCMKRKRSNTPPAKVVIFRDEEGTVKFVYIERKGDKKKFAVPFKAGQEDAAVNDAHMVAKQINEGDMSWFEARGWIK